ncbi:MAG: L,D-transpeptidase, partial [Polyangiaceae bacterium]|nr:L,D-transpeptidase [Polyangiaceae bacterium]
RPIRGSDFHGFLLGKEVQFPFAIVRHPNARFWQRSPGKARMVDAGPAPYRSALQLSGKQDLVKGHLYYETEDHRWLSDLHASRFLPARRMPGWGKRGEKWIDINLTQQSLMLYDGTEPVYATLISSGEAGLEDPEHTTATKRGIFRIHTKHLTATMSSDEVGEEFELRDVPYVQYFDKEGYALHGAYWHDRFGIPKSHGCINLSPEDARRIFYFTEPRLPVGWHGVLLPLKGTVMFVHP